MGAFWNPNGGIITSDSSLLNKESVGLETKLVKESQLPFFPSCRCIPR